MTTLELNHTPTETMRPRNVFAWLKAVLQHRRQEARRRRVMLELSELDAYLLRDIGISSTDVQDELQGRRRFVWLDPLPREHDNP